MAALERRRPTSRHPASPTCSASRGSTSPPRRAPRARCGPPRPIRRARRPGPASRALLRSRCSAAAAAFGLDATAPAQRAGRRATPAARRRRSHCRGRGLESLGQPVEAVLDRGQPLLDRVLGRPLRPSQLVAHRRSCTRTASRSPRMPRPRRAGRSARRPAPVQPADGLVVSLGTSRSERLEPLRERDSLARRASGSSPRPPSLPGSHVRLPSSTAQPATSSSVRDGDTISP